MLKVKIKRPNCNPESGQVLVWVAILLPLLLVLVGLVFDGGLMWVRYRRARWAIDGAAVAAASVIDVPLYAETGQVKLHDDALLVADWYARRNDPSLHVDEVYVQDNAVYVKGHSYAETVFLSMFGVEGLRLPVRGRERPAWGISEEGQ
jgi:hypothetical protein